MSLDFTESTVESQSRDHRRSIRLKGYDYTRTGAYFVTICTQDRVCLLGAVVDGEMRLNEYGRKVADGWSWLAEQYPYVDLDEWVVMPNHLHGIIVITDGNGRAGGSGGGGLDGGRGGSRTAPTGSPPTTPASKRKSLGRLIGAFKTVSTKRVNDICSTPGAKLWQRNYYEHVIRDDASLQRIREYIANNPARWGLDRERKSASSKSASGKGASRSAPTAPTSPATRDQP